MLRSWNGERAERLARLFRALAGVASAAAIGLFLAVALARVGFPYELEWMEGGVLDHVARVAEGRPLYVAPSLEFTPFLYTPLFYWVCAPLVRIFGVELWVLRAVSISATLALLGLLGYAVSRDARDRVAGLAAAGLFAATFAASGGWLDLARVDALSLLLLFAGAWLLVRDERHDFVAGTLLAAAVLTKQTALVVAVFLCATRLVTGHGWGRARPSLVVSGWLAAAVVLLERSSSGWFLFYVWDLPRAHGMALPHAVDFWREDLLATVPFVLALALLHLASSTWGGATAGRWGAVTGMLVASWGARAHVGGWSNVLLPAYLALSWMAGEAIARVRPGDGTVPERAPAGSASWLVPALVLVQIAWLGYRPAPNLPTEADRRALGELVERLRSIEGPVLAPAHTQLGRLAGADATAHEMALIDVLRSDRLDVAHALRQDIRRALRERRYAAVVLDHEWWGRELRRSYRPLLPPPVGDPEALWTRAGKPTRPAQLWVPRGSRTASAGAERGGDGGSPAASP